MQREGCQAFLFQTLDSHNICSDRSSRVPCVLLMRFSWEQTSLKMRHASLPHALMSTGLSFVRQTCHIK